MAQATNGDAGFDLHNVEEEDHWISVSDLMAGLMMVFLFISIALMRNAILESDKVKKVAVAYQDNQVAIYGALVNEFEGDLDRWKAEIKKDTLSFEFKSPDVLFEEAETELKPEFKKILSDFFPRYLKVLSGFRSSINEVRIEGHTDSIWNQSVSTQEAYFKNMGLSQGRTRSVLQYVYSLPDVATEKVWMKRHIAAVGFSSSHLILKQDGQEDRIRSRRVTFRTITNADIQIRKILDE